MEKNKRIQNETPARLPDFDFNQIQAQWNLYREIYYQIIPRPFGLGQICKIKKSQFPTKMFLFKRMSKKTPKCVNVVSITPFKKITEFMAPWSGFQALGRNQNANIMKKYYKIFYRIFFLYSHINLEKNQIHSYDVYKVLYFNCKIHG